MCKLGVEEWLVSAVMSMYSGAKTVVRTVYGNSKNFEVKVGMHQGSALSRVVPDKRPLNGCMCVCVRVCIQFACLYRTLPFFLTYLLPHLSFPLRIDPLCFQTGWRKRRLNLALVFLHLFCVVVHFVWSMNACFYCVRFSFFLSRPDWLVKWLRNDLFCVEWDVKPQLKQSIKYEGRMVWGCPEDDILSTWHQTLEICICMRHCGWVCWLANIRLAYKSAPVIHPSLIFCRGQGLGPTWIYSRKSHLSKSGLIRKYCDYKPCLCVMWNHSIISR